MQGKNIFTAVILAVLLLICGLAGAKAWAEASQAGVPVQPPGGPAWVTTTPSPAAVTSSQPAATGGSEGTKASDPATSGQQAAEPEDGGPDSGGDG